MDTLIQRKELIDILFNKGYTKKEAGMILDDVFGVIKEALLDGKDVNIHGFGTFVIREMAARETINVKTKERVVLPAHKAPKFVAGDALKSAIKLHCRAGS